MLKRKIITLNKITIVIKNTSLIFVNCPLIKLSKIFPHTPEEHELLLSKLINKEKPTQQKRHEIILKKEIT